MSSVDVMKERSQFGCEAYYGFDPEISLSKKLTWLLPHRRIQFGIYRICMQATADKCRDLIECLCGGGRQAMKNSETKNSKWMMKDLELVPNQLKIFELWLAFSVDFVECVYQIEKGIFFFELIIFFLLFFLI